MKRWVLPLVIFVVVLAACGQNNSNDASQSNQKTLNLKTAE